MDEKKLRVKKIFLSHWLILLLVLVFFLRLPSLFEPFTYGDEGIYLTLGQAVRKGLVLYRDIHDNKPPMLYLVAALAGNFSIYRLILFFWSFATIFIFYKFCQLLFNKNKQAIIISTVAFAVLTSLHNFEGNIANAENFMMLPTIAAFYLVLKKRQSKKTWFLAGCLLSLAALFKIPAGFDFLALLILAVLINKKFNLGVIVRRWLGMTVGFLLPILFSLGYYATQGAFNQYLRAAFLQNIPYLASWASDKPQTMGLPLALITRTSLLLTVVILLFIRRKKIATEIKLIVLWFFFSLFAALLSGRPYPHYLLQVLPALSLSFGLLSGKKKQKMIPLTLLVFFISAFLFFRFWYYPNLPYYQNFYQFALGAKSKEEYFDSFDREAQTLYRTASFIKARTGEEEKIFIWGTRPSIYALSRRLPVGRYTVSYHIIDFNGYEATIKALVKIPPRYLIVSGDEKRPFPELNAFIQNNYVFDIQIDSLQIFHRIL